jgi:hypothetical protein
MGRHSAARHRAPRSHHAGKLAGLVVVIGLASAFTASSASNSTSSHGSRAATHAAGSQAALPTAPRTSGPASQSPGTAGTASAGAATGTSSSAATNSSSGNSPLATSSIYDTPSPSILRPGSSASKAATHPGTTGGSKTTAKAPTTKKPKPSKTPSRSATTGIAPGAAAAALALPYAPLGGPFGASSVWKQNISTAPLAANSAAEIANLVPQVTSLYGGIAAFNVNQYNTTFYTATAATPKVDVGFNNCQNKPSTPTGLLGPGGEFSQVPIPANAVPATGTDGELTIWSPSSDQLWEFWVAQRDANGNWTACWGGRIDHVSSSPGYFSNGYGASASGLAISGGMIEIEDARAGVINHALALAIPSPAIWSDVSWPAQRSDGGSTDSAAIPEGTRLRLDPSINVDALPLTPIAKLVAKAAQKYGFIVTDSSGAVAVVAESGAADQKLTGVNPWAAFMGSTPDYLTMRNFPWASLQALPKNYGQP